MKKILVIVGTRPNFIKITQLPKAFEPYAKSVELKILHTGQHYDKNLSDVFFEQFNLWPDFNLDIKPASPVTQIAEMIIALEAFIQNEYQPDLLVAVGDVNSTLACAIVATKLSIRLAHIESGLRSYDKTMPEEINRVITDEIADICFVTEKSGENNLLKEGKSEDTLHFSGNTMIDTLVAFQESIDGSDVLDNLHLQPADYALITTHRQALVDNEDNMKRLQSIIYSVAQKIGLVYPIHPRTMKQLKEFGLYDKLQASEQIKLIDPADYFSKQETSHYDIPCLTLRPNTELLSTLDPGTNVLVNLDEDLINQEVEKIFEGTFKSGATPEYWDGKASARIAEKLNEIV
ncbi:MAG: UDP-N-acetylglucosamine 2-epimerase (non-hydrolyzing) [Bacteroidetes bacterium]|nr:UDP-N-acetylglucosamine 2-epimerase (non-hydrolyzing) [Bacteroidota bacterium]